MEHGGSVSDAMQWFATLGVGGVLAGMMFFFYRKDVRAITELWKTQTELLVNVVQENTRSNVQLTSVVDALHRRLDRNGLHE